MSQAVPFATTLAARLPAHWPVPHHAARRLLERWVEEALQRGEDDLFAARFARTCPVPGLPASAYRHRVLRAPGAPTLLAGIRFKGGQTAFPFVELLAWSTPLLGPADWLPVRKRLEDAFAGFSPRAIRVRWPGPQPPPFGKPGEFVVDQRLLAARLGLLHKQPRPWGEVSVDLRVVGDLGWYRQYRQAHAAWRSQAGGLGAEVLPQPEEAFARCLETGLVVGVFESGCWQGVAAASRQREADLDGYCLAEIFLQEGMRGRRRAAPLLRHLIDRLPDAGRDVVHATVHRLNLPSRSTAQRCGLACVATFWFSGLGSETGAMSLRW